MPQTLNPPNGFFANANNDPAGTSLDNDVLNQRRLSNPNAIYYLSGGYDEGLRSGRITQLVRDQVQSGVPISIADMQRFQTNTQERDAELMAPFVVAGLRERAGARRARGTRRARGRRAHRGGDRPARGVGFLDADRHPRRLGRERPARRAQRRRCRHSEITASVAATLYNVWRAKLIKNVIDARLAALGVSGVGATRRAEGRPPPARAGALHRRRQLRHRLLRRARVRFRPNARRDVALLTALRDALDALASNAYAAAFANSTDQDDYRWGKLHRKTFNHALGGDFSLPPYAGFEDLAPDLLGTVARRRLRSRERLGLQREGRRRRTRSASAADRCVATSAWRTSRPMAAAR